MRKLLLIGAISAMFSVGSLNAAEFEVGLAPVWWQYQEQSGQRTGMPSTPFYSKASGYALAAESVIQYDMNQQLLIEGSWRGVLSGKSTIEKWQLNGGEQTNQLAINQSEFQVGLIGKLDAIHVGVWSSYLWHQQSRKQFVSKGVPVILIGEPLKETVQTVWIGTTLRYDLRNWLLAIDVGIPVWTHVTNDLIPSVFRRRSGYRISVGMKRKLSWKLANAETAITAAYHYRVLGKDLKPIALWPKNTWSTLSIGVSLIW